LKSNLWSSKSTNY